ncbi:MAG: hypothetical protein ACK5NF_03660 [Bacilli bacterium]
MNLKVVTPYKTMVNIKASEIMLGGCEGHFTIFEDHATFVSRLKISTGYYVSDDGLHAFSIKGGFSSVDDNEVVVITSKYVDEVIKKKQEVVDKTIEFSKMTREEVGMYFESV